MNQIFCHIFQIPPRKYCQLNKKTTHSDFGLVVNKYLMVDKDWENTFESNLSPERLEITFQIDECQMH